MRRLPFPDASADALAMVSMLHLVPDWSAALAEARRVLRPGGRLAVFLAAREHLDAYWVLDYFPSSRGWMTAGRPSLTELLGALPSAIVVPVRFDRDVADASIGALCRHPELLLDPAVRSQTSYFAGAPGARRADSGADALGSRPGRPAATPRAADRVAAVRARYGDAAVVGYQRPTALAVRNHHPQRTPAAHSQAVDR